MLGVGITRVVESKMRDLYHFSKVFFPHWRKSKRALEPGPLCFTQFLQPPPLYSFYNLSYLSGISRESQETLQSVINRQFIMCVEAARLKNTIWVNSVFAVLSVFNLVRSGGVDNDVIS